MRVAWINNYIPCSFTVFLVFALRLHGGIYFHCYQYISTGALRVKQNNINGSIGYFKRVLRLDSGNKQALNFLRTLK